MRQDNEEALNTLCAQYLSAKDKTAKQNILTKMWKICLGDAHIKSKIANFRYSTRQNANIDPNNFDNAVYDTLDYLLTKYTGTIEPSTFTGLFSKSFNRALISVTRKTIHIQTNHIGEFDIVDQHPDDSPDPVEESMRRAKLEQLQKILKMLKPSLQKTLNNMDLKCLEAFLHSPEVLSHDGAPPQIKGRNRNEHNLVRKFRTELLKIEGITELYSAVGNDMELMYILATAIIDATHDVVDKKTSQDTPGMHVDTVRTPLPPTSVDINALPHLR